jgi:NIPSNAP
MLRSTLLSMLVLASCAANAATTFLCGSNGDQIQQLRIYEVNRSNRDNFHERFQEHALRIMKRHDFSVVDMWESDTGDKLQFVYVLAWPNEATMDSRCKSFLADQEWIDIKKHSAAGHGELVKEADGQPLVRVSYSPACKADQ